MTRKLPVRHIITSTRTKRRVHPRRKDGTFKPSQRGKYKAAGRWLDDHFFPSKAEADRYEQLKELVRMGRIVELELQPRFPLRVANQLVCTYVADFRYKKIVENRIGWISIVEEVKGMRTREYIIKQKLLHALLPDIRISELKVPRRGGVERMRYLTADEVYAIPKD